MDCSFARSGSCGVGVVGSVYSVCNMQDVQLLAKTQNRPDAAA